MNVDNSQGRDKYLRGEEYRRKRNPSHYADSNMFEDKEQARILTHNEKVNNKNSRDGSVRQSLGAPSKYSRKLTFWVYRAQNMFKFDSETILELFLIFSVQTVCERLQRLENESSIAIVWFK